MATVSAALCFGAYAFAAPSVSQDAGAETPGVSMSYSYGFDNTAKSGRLIPFDILISNNSDADFTGTLFIETSGVMQDSALSYTPAALSYVYPIQLEGGDSLIKSITISVPSQGGEVSLSLIDDSGTVTASDSARIDLDEGRGAGVLVGILSDTPERLEYFRNVSISGTGLSTKTVELDPQNLPQSASGYEQLDILIVSSLSMSGIDESALEAIELWVQGGGVLIVGTGDSSEEALSLARNVRELSITPIGSREVNMGIKYSKTDDPDEAMLKLSLSEIFLEDGLEVMQSDDIAMLIRVPHANGIIALTAYDLCDLAGFCTEEVGYTEDILVGVLSTARISELITHMDSSREYYELADSIVGVADTPSEAVLIPYAVLAAVFVVLIIGLNLYLNDRGLAAFFHVFVLMAAFLIALLVRFVGAGERDEGLNLRYAYIREFSDGFGKETGFLRSEAPEQGTYSLLFTDDMEVYPIVFGLDESPSLADTISLTEQSEGIRYEFSSRRAFSGVLSEFSRTLSADEPSGIEARLEYFGAGLTGEVINSNDYTLEDVSVLMYGEFVRIGDIGPLSSAVIEEQETLSYPVGHPETMAKLLTGTESDPVAALRRERLLSYYIDDALNYNFSDARIIAFVSDMAAAPSVSPGDSLDMSGDMMLVISCEADNVSGDYVWINCLMNEPGVISGDYDLITNSTTGTCVLEYTLGSGIRVTDLSFRGLADESAGDGTVPFDGAISIYNYEDGSYDYTGNAGLTLSGEEVGRYLSPGNTVIVRYTPTEAQMGEDIYLPMPFVTGIPGDTNA